MTKTTQRKGTRKGQEPGGEETHAKQEDQIVLVVDDDESALDAIIRLIRSAGFKVRGFSSASALLNERLPPGDICLVADIYLSEMTGVELCHTLAVSGRALPTILITARNDEMTRRLIENSEAVKVLYKPIDEVPLLDAISRCLNSRGVTQSDP